MSSIFLIYYLRFIFNTTTINIAIIKYNLPIITLKNKNKQILVLFIVKTKRLRLKI